MSAELDSVTVEELVTRLQKQAESVDHAKVYFTLKKMRLRHIHAKTVEVVKAIIALTDNGLPINTHLVGYIMKKDIDSVRSTLHLLGDKHVITLKRGGEEKKGRPFTWFLSSTFAELYYGKRPRGVE